MFKLRRCLSSFIWQFFTAILVVIAIAACNNNTPTKPNSVLTENCRVIQHAMGETCVPSNPQRIVVLDYVMLEATLALDIKPVGSPIEFAPPSVNTTGIVNLGDVNAVSLERVLELKPDLILGITDSPPPYSQLSQIAPTVLVDFEHSGEWKEHFAFVGEVLDKSEEVNRVMSDYYQRAKEFQQNINGDSSKTTVSIVRIYPTQIALYTKVGFPGTILEDEGLSRPPSQNLDLEETRASLKNDPLWSKFEAVEQGKVYEVWDYWIGSGAIAANLVLDDLEKYLIDK